MDVVRALDALSHGAWQAAATARILGGDLSTDKKIAVMGISVYVDDVAVRLQEVQKRVRELFELHEYLLTEPPDSVVPIAAPAPKRAAKAVK